MENLNTHDFTLFSTTRKHFINFLGYYDVGNLQKIPEGYKNSIFWNIAHALVTQQLLCYYLTDNDMLIDDEWVSKYKKGTVQEGKVTEKEVKLLEKYLSKTTKQFASDYENEKMSYYRPYETSFGVELNNIEEAFRFNYLHEAIHLGYVMAMRKKLN